ncbi:MAG TPA: hypothetical protein VFI42_05930 [Thermomicrobiaceae bacterium]|nr:hypothetical protein [Thermomicrobiaceae bacterium]
MTQRTPSTGQLAWALAGALLMFAGWLLAILPAFRHLHRVWLVVVLAVVLYGLVLVPSSLDIFTNRPRGNGKRGAGTLAISLVPALAIFVILVVVAPLSLLAGVLAIVVELAGMALYGWAWWRYQHAG